MRIISFFALIGLVAFATGCSSSRKSIAPTANANAKDIRSSVVIKKKVPAVTIQTKSISANELVKFAETLIGVNRYNIKVPRISYDFTNAGSEVLLKDSRRGDLILFTGSDEKSGVVGHMGIITENKNGFIQFIHASTSRGVMISGMNTYYIPRYVKTNRIFRD